MTDTKKCLRCGEDKDKILFSPRRSAKDGLFPWCMDCNRVYMREYYITHGSENRSRGAEWRSRNKDQIHAKNVAHHAKNKEYRRSHAAEYYSVNREKIADAGLRRRAADPGRFKGYAKKTMQKNPAIGTARRSRRRARERGAGGGGVTVAQWKQVLDDSLGLCAYCNARPAKLEVDHVVPLARHGEHGINNLVASCRQCNASKGDATLVVWMASRMRRIVASARA